MTFQKVNESLSVRDGLLFVEDCDAAQLVESFGGPLFVVSENHLRSNLRRFKHTFAKHWPEGSVRIMPSLKASPLIAVRRVLSDEGCGCDVFGPGELEGAIRGGVVASEISVNGSIKSREIIRRAISVGARIVLDSPRELEICEQEAASLQTEARVMFRLKPFMEDLETASDFAPSMSIRELTQLIKYGIPGSELLPMGPRALELAHVRPIGIHVHMGRHSKHLKVWRHWVRQCILLTKTLSEEMGGWVPKEIDLGGGFPSDSDSDTDVAVSDYESPTLEQFAEAITSELRDTLNHVGISPQGILLEVEPGRALHTDTGIHLTTVKNVKEEQHNRPRQWIEVDTSEVFLGIGGLNEEPPFEFMFANKASSPLTAKADIVGQTCNAELLFKQVKTPALEVGDVVALLNTGAYIEPMAANFNALPRPGTVLVCGDRAEMIRRHETVEEVFNRDEIPERLR